MSDPLVRCIDCAKFGVQRAPEWRQISGFGCCERYPVWLVFHADRGRDCDSFVKAAADVVTKRAAWLRITKERGGNDV